MATQHRPVWPLVRRVVISHDLDLYMLAAGALVFAVLGTIGVADIVVVSSAILALLTLMAFAQIRSRRQVAEIIHMHRVTPTDALRTEFPADLAIRRKDARTLLLIGRSLDRTLETGRADLENSLAAGAQIRVLLVDPSSDSALHVAASASTDFDIVDEIRERIHVSLRHLVRIKERTGSQLEIRVTTTVPHVGVNAIDIESEHGLIVVQYYEYRPHGESVPILKFDVKDGFWFHHFVAEANRLWDAGHPWPPDAGRIAAQAPRPTFRDRFDAEVLEVLSRSKELLITGITRNTLLSSEYGRFEKLLRSGCRIRFLLVDPDSDAILVAAERYYARHSPEFVRGRVVHSLDLLQQLLRITDGDLQVRLTQYPLALGIIAVDYSDEARSVNSFVFSEYYTYRAAGEPKFTLQPAENPWFGHFVQEAEELWGQARPFVQES